MVNGWLDAGSILKHLAGLTDEEINSMDRETAIEAAEAVQSQHEILVGSWEGPKIKNVCHNLAEAFLEKEVR